MPFQNIELFSRLKTTKEFISKPIKIIILFLLILHLKYLKINKYLSMLGVRNIYFSKFPGQSYKVMAYVLCFVGPHDTCKSLYTVQVVQKPLHSDAIKELVTYIEQLIIKNSSNCTIHGPQII